MAFVITWGTLIESYEDRSQNLATAALVGTRDRVNEFMLGYHSAHVKN